MSEHGSLAAIQKAYGDWGGAQCGFCTPGFIMTVKSLLAENPDPSEDDVRAALEQQSVPLHRLQPDVRSDPVGDCGGAARDGGWMTSMSASRQRIPRFARNDKTSDVKNKAELQNAMSTFSIIGKPTAMIDAAEKTTGAGKYTDDLSVPGMLVGKILHSPYPHARIKRIDTSRAEKLDGVVAVVIGKDAPNPYGILRSATTSMRSRSTRCDTSGTTSLAWSRSPRRSPRRRWN